MRAIGLVLFLSIFWICICEFGKDILTKKYQGTKWDKILRPTFTFGQPIISFFFAIVLIILAILDIMK